MDSIIPEITLIAGLLLGILMILAVVWRYVSNKEKNLTIREMVFVLMGVMLLGLSLWSTLKVSASEDGILAEFVMIQSQLATNNTAIATYNKNTQENLALVRSNAILAIQAYTTCGYSVLDERWSNIYAKAEKVYREKRNISSSSQLDRDQLQDIAGLATLMRDDVRKKIRKREEEMIQAIMTSPSGSSNPFEDTGFIENSLRAAGF